MRRITMLALLVAVTVGLAPIASAAPPDPSVDALFAEVEQFAVELEKVERGNMAAGDRALVNLKEIRALSRQMLNETRLALQGQPAQVEEPDIGESPDASLLKARTSALRLLWPDFELGDHLAGQQSQVILLEIDSIARDFRSYIKDVQDSFR